LDRCGAGADRLESHRAEVDFVVAHVQGIASIRANSIHSTEPKGVQLVVAVDVQFTTYGLELICVKGAQLAVVGDVQSTTYGLELICVKGAQLVVV